MPSNVVKTAASRKPSRRCRKSAASVSAVVDHCAILARRLDLLADCELQHGHHGVAERLSRHAAELRVVTP